MGLRWGDLDCEDLGESHYVFDLHLEASREAEEVVIRLSFWGASCVEEGVKRRGGASVRRVPPGKQEKASSHW